jgi:hypothetical protein
MCDPCRRKEYDQTGSIEDAEDFTSEDFKSLYEFIKSQLEEVRLLTLCICLHAHLLNM